MEKRLIEPFTVLKFNDSITQKDILDKINELISALNALEKKEPNHYCHFIPCPICEKKLKGPEEENFRYVAGEDIGRGKLVYLEDDNKIYYANKEPEKKETLEEKIFYGYKDGMKRSLDPDCIKKVSSIARQWFRDHPEELR